MKVFVIIVFIEIIVSPLLSVSQTILDSTVNKNKGIPNVMFDVSYSNKYLCLNNDNKTNYSNGDIALKLNNDIELSIMGLFKGTSKSKRNKLYGGSGINFSEYQVSRNIFYQPSYSGHFPLIYSASPNKLEYKLQLLRLQVQLGHYTFYKRLIIFQKLGLGYNFYIKKDNSAAHYTEQYGNSVPNQDPAYVTPTNPDGWYFKDNYTYTDKNDLDTYKNAVSAFYKFGLGVRIKQFTPFAAFDISYSSKSLASRYLKFQVGINYSILPK